MARKVVEKWSLACFLHLSCATARSGRFQSVERVEATRQNGVEEKMLTEMIHNTRAMKAVRWGLIVTSWTFLVLGFVLKHNA